MSTFRLTTRFLTMTAMVMSLTLVPLVAAQSPHKPPVSGKSQADATSRDDQMKQADLTKVRTLVYEGPLGVHVNQQLPVPAREVIVDKTIRAIHKRHRIDTLKLLLDIAKGGRPSDAISAGATAIALEDNSASAIIWIDSSLEKFDKVRDDGLPMPRERLVKEMEQNLVKALEEVKKEAK